MARPPPPSLARRTALSNGRTRLRGAARTAGLWPSPPKRALHFAAGEGSRERAAFACNCWPTSGPSSRRAARRRKSPGRAPPAADNGELPGASPSPGVTVIRNCGGVTVIPRRPSFKEAFASSPQHFKTQIIHIDDSCLTTDTSYHPIHAVFHQHTQRQLCTPRRSSAARSLCGYETHQPSEQAPR